MTWMTPDEYEMLQALNAWAGRSDLVGLRHVDELNQTCGRNLGFRHRGEARHIVIANLRLFNTLVAHDKGVLGRLRYGLVLRTTSEERRDKGLPGADVPDTGLPL